MDGRRELDIADLEITAWRFSFDDALMQGDVAVKGAVALRPCDLDQILRAAAVMVTGLLDML